MATMLYRKQRAEIGFAGSMTTILTWVTRSAKIDPGRLRTVNCKLFWTRTISNRKKCLPSNWVSSSHFHAVTCHGEGSKDRKMGSAWTERQADGTMPKHMPNSACQTKKKVVLASDCDRWWKVDLFSESWNARNLGLIPLNHQHLPQD